MPVRAALYQKIAEYVRPLEDNSPIDLQLIFPHGEHTPPPTSPKIPMAFSVPASGGDETSASTSTAVGDQRYLFPDVMLMDSFVENILRQNLQLPAYVWRLAIKFFEETNFTDRCSGQVQLEALAVLSNLDSYEFWMSGNAVDAGLNRGSTFGDLVDCFLGAVMSKNVENRIQEADEDLVQKIKPFLAQNSIVDAFYFCLNDVFSVENGGEEVDEPQQKRLKFNAGDGQKIDKLWILQQIKTMKIYVVEKLGPLKGVTLTDGVLLCTGELVSRQESEARHNADLFTLCCHETGHFLARMFVGFYNFATPCKDKDGNRSVERMDKEIPQKSLELGRFVEITMFGGIQPDWSIHGDSKAVVFIQAAADNAHCPPALIGRDEHSRLRLRQRRPSFSFAAELCQPKLLIE